MSSSSHASEPGDQIAPGTAPVGSVAWCAMTLERIGDAVVALAPDGVVVWGNAAGLAALGGPSCVGQSAFGFVHPDDVERAVETIAFGAGRTGAEVPVTFRLGPPGQVRRWSIRGHGLGSDPSGATLLAVAREADHEELLDEVLDELAGTANYHRVASLICAHLVHPLWGASAAVRWGGSRGPGAVDAVAVGDELQEAIASTATGVWLDRTLLRSEGTLYFEATDVPPLHEALVAAGFGALNVRRVDAPTSGASLDLVIPSPAHLQPNLGFGRAIERCARLLRMALTHRWQMEQLEQISRTDPLTGLANRRRFTFALRDLHAAGTRSMVVVTDLDGFKPVNDQLGHRAGDLVLVEVARRLSSVAGPRSLVARLGGDEFAVVTPEGPDTDQLVERLRRAAEHDVVLPDGTTVHVGISLGISWSRPGRAIEDVLDEADANCRSDKALRQRPR